MRALLVLPLTTAVGILVMIYGWGLQPVSWAWIIGGYFAMFILGCLAVVKP